MKKVFQKTNIIATAIFCIAACALWAPSCFAEEWYGEPALIINQNPYTAQGVAAFQSITKAYNENSFGGRAILALPAENYNEWRSASTLQSLSTTGSSPRIAVRSSAQSTSPALVQQSQNTFSAPLAGSNNNLNKITSAAPDTRITGSDAAKANVVQNLKIHIATQQENRSNACLDEKEAVIKNKTSSQIQENAAKKQTSDSANSLKQQEFSDCGRKPAKESNTITSKTQKRHAEDIAADQAQSVMPYQRPLFTDKPSFKNKSQINSVRKDTKYNAETMYNAVCGIMPYLKNGLINQSKVLAAKEDIDPLLPPARDPVGNEPVDVPERSEAYKQSLLDTTGYDGIDIYPANNKNINPIAEEIICLDTILKQAINYSKTGLSPPDKADITNSLLFSRQSLPIFSLSSPLNQTVSQSSTNSIIDPPMRLREGFSFIERVLSEASLNFNNRAAFILHDEGHISPPRGVALLNFLEINIINRTAHQKGTNG